MMTEQDRDGMSGSELQESQSGGESGEFGGNRAQQQSGQGGIGGQQLGGGAEAPDMGAGGGSSGTGGYGNAQNQANHQGQQGGAGQAAYGNSGRGAAFDEAQGGGRGVDDISRSADERYGGSSGEFDEEDGNPAADEFLRDQQAHQDRGQSEAEEEAG
jgi:hypothetical protein